MHSAGSYIYICGSCTLVLFRLCPVARARHMHDYIPYIYIFFLLLQGFAGLRLLRIENSRCHGRLDWNWLLYGCGSGTLVLFRLCPIYIYSPSPRYIYIYVDRFAGLTVVWIGIAWLRGLYIYGSGTLVLFRSHPYIGSPNPMYTVRGLN